jgi:hypothetical protein
MQHLANPASLNRIGSGIARKKCEIEAHSFYGALARFGSIAVAELPGRRRQDLLRYRTPLTRLKPAHEPAARGHRRLYLGGADRNQLDPIPLRTRGVAWAAAAPHRLRGPWRVDDRAGTTAWWRDVGFR